MQTPKVGEPVFYNVTNYVEVLSDELQLIRDWANDRNLIAEGDATTQFLKLTEEVGELAQSIFKKQEDEFVDALGDIVVVLTNMAAMKGIKLEHCVNSAYNVIKDRKGKMINGTFVKEI
jgi:NTP pyrophosphatase (non-canonical NTP hydrolase)